MIKIMKNKFIFLIKFYYFNKFYLVYLFLYNFHFEKKINYSILYIYDLFDLYVDYNFVVIIIITLNIFYIYKNNYKHNNNFYSFTF